MNQTTLTSGYSVRETQQALIVEPLLRVLENLGEKKLAVSILDVLGKHATRYEEHNIVAKNYHTLKKYEKALDHARKCLELLENSSESQEHYMVALKNVIQCLNSSNKGKQALEKIKEIKDKPEFYDDETKIQEAFALFITNKKDEAEKLLVEVINSTTVSEEDRDVAKFNMAAHDFRHGRFLDGLSKFIYYGRKKNTNLKSSLSFQPWVNQRNVKNVILTSEAGIGDEFVNIRFIKEIENRGLKAYWYTQREELRNFFYKAGYRTITKEKLEKMNPRETACCNAMEAPLHLRMKEEDLYKKPYINLAPVSTLIDRTRLKIGLRWAGNPEYEHDLQRTIPISNLYDIIKGTDKIFYSFQRDNDTEILTHPLMKDVVNLEKTGSLDTINTTWHHLSEMDLVITSCTSIAHMAASMGIHTWVLVPIANYYVWSHPINKREGVPYYNTNWYGKNVKIFQQKTPSHWIDVFDDVARELELFHIKEVSNV